MSVQYYNTLWDKIEEVKPDEWDLKMFDEIENDPDCKEFVSADEVYKSLEIEYK
jgi:hypothetical protein